MAKPDPSRAREFADDVRDGKFVLPIGRRMPLRDAAEAHALGEKGGVGKTSCSSQTHNPLVLRSKCGCSDQVFGGERFGFRTKYMFNSVLTFRL